MPHHKPLKGKTSFSQKLFLLVSGVILTFVILEVSLRLAGFMLFSIQNYKNYLSLQRQGAYRIMCLGESTTQGQYPSFLEEALNKSDTGRKFSVIDKGIFGTTTTIIVAQLESNLAAYHPDMVVTMMGINERGPHMYHENFSRARPVLFFRSLRTYKLIRIMWLHVKEFIALKPKNDEAYVELGLSYFRQGKLPQTEDAYKKAIKLNPGNGDAYFCLGEYYNSQGKLTQAEDAYKRAVELDPKSYDAYIGLGWLYYRQGKLTQAEDALKKAVESHLRGSRAYTLLGEAYDLDGKFSQAEDALKRAIELNPAGGRAYAALSVLYKEIGKPALAEQYAQNADRLRLDYYNPVTIDNYREVKRMLDKRGIPLVCVQYPMRSIEPLKKIFEKDTEGVIFVDNEKIFKDAVKKESYREYFVDMFGVDFGHCTEKGNRLLAENIANVIAKEAFKK